MLVIAGGILLAVFVLAALRHAGTILIWLVALYLLGTIVG